MFGFQSSKPACAGFLFHKLVLFNSPAIERQRVLCRGKILRSQYSEAEKQATQYSRSEKQAT
ncbi:hypothetical protein [Brunnivagina elsteri]|uniref:hypothetical protein n=1 Tax=Brunnivagina elsteri TaxID=1247191 RepID=UPI00130440F2|nr:hypothetical protein [Calothrix elsteri]